VKKHKRTYVCVNCNKHTISRVLYYNSRAVGCSFFCPLCQETTGYYRRTKDKHRNKQKGIGAHGRNPNN